MQNFHKKKLIITITLGSLIGLGTSLLGMNPETPAKSSSRQCPKPYRSVINQTPQSKLYSDLQGFKEIEGPNQRSPLQELQDFGKELRRFAAYITKTINKLKSSQPYQAALIKEIFTKARPKFIEKLSNFNKRIQSFPGDQEILNAYIYAQNGFEMVETRYYKYCEKDALDNAYDEDEAKDEPLESFDYNKFESEYLGK